MSTPSEVRSFTLKTAIVILLGGVLGTEGKSCSLSLYKDYIFLCNSSKKTGVDWL